MRLCFPHRGLLRSPDSRDNGGNERWDCGSETATRRRKGLMDVNFVSGRRQRLFKMQAIIVGGPATLKQRGRTNGTRVRIGRYPRSVRSTPLSESKCPDDFLAGADPAPRGTGETSRSGAKKPGSWPPPVRRRRLARHPRVGPAPPMSTWKSRPSQCPTVVQKKVKRIGARCSGDNWMSTN